ncbi:MAG TPA: hypothetical protein VJ023_15025 [Pyrinomonadaceae bacterium]|nr:hypothetical protein [Pyrinomonadaceae bacterium]
MQSQSARPLPPKSELGQSELPTLPELNGKPMSANGLRNGLYKALSRFALPERVLLYKRLIGDLEKAGIRVGSRLFLLGIPAKIPEELTPSDIGKLIRSVYLNEPQAIAAISETLKEILSMTNGQKLPQRNNKTGRKTASHSSAIEE